MNENFNGGTQPMSLKQRINETMKNTIKDVQDTDRLRPIISGRGN